MNENEISMKNEKLLARKKNLLIQPLSKLILITERYNKIKI